MHSHALLMILHCQQLASQHVLLSCMPCAGMQGHTGRVSCLALSPSGRLLASGQITYLGFTAGAQLLEPASDRTPSESTRMTQHHAPTTVPPHTQHLLCCCPACRHHHLGPGDPQLAAQAAAAEGELTLLFSCAELQRGGAEILAWRRRGSGWRLRLPHANEPQGDSPPL